MKTHDATDWMSKWDPTPDAVTGPQRVADLAQHFEANGVPFHTYAVVKGIDPIREAQMAAEVLGGGRPQHLPGPRALGRVLAGHAGGRARLRRGAAASSAGRDDHHGDRSPALGARRHPAQRVRLLQQRAGAPRLLGDFRLARDAGRLRPERLPSPSRRGDAGVPAGRYLSGAVALRPAAPARGSRSLRFIPMGALH